MFLLIFSVPQPCRFEVEQYGVYGGGHPDTVTSEESVESCLSQCLTEATCLYVSYLLNQDCVLYSSVTTRLQQEGAVTFIRKCSAGRLELI